MRAADVADADPSPAPTGCHIDRVFRALALASVYILVRRWRAGGAGLRSRPAPAEIAAVVALCASLAWLYALPAFGVRWSSTRRRHQD